MRRQLGVLTTLLLLGIALPAQAAGLPRVASSGLCADQFLLMLGAREQIASVSWQATGPLSVQAARAKGLPTNRGSAEEILRSGADLLLSSDGMEGQSAAALKRLGVEVYELPFANTFTEVETLTRQVATRLGRPEAGERVIRDMRARLARVRPAGPRDAWPVMAYYRPDGGSAGVDTFVDSTLSAAGYRNLQVMRGVTGWGGLPAEAVVTTPPDVFGVSYFDTNRTSESVLRRNPIVWGAARDRAVITIPGKYWNCGSPLLVDAVELLARERPGVLADRRRKAAR